MSDLSAKWAKADIDQVAVRDFFRPAVTTRTIDHRERLWDRGARFAAARLL